MKKPPPEKETEYTKLIGMLSAYEKILHPDIFKPLMHQVLRVYEESRQKAYADAYANAKISEEALQVDKLIKEMRGWYGTNGQELSPLHYRHFYKKILQIFLQL